MSTLQHIYIFLWAGIKFKAASFFKVEERGMLRSQPRRNERAGYANERKWMSKWQWRIDEDRERLSWLRGKWMTERTSDVRFQRKVSRRYHGSHCDSRINFNAPLWRFCVTLPLSFFSSQSTHCHLLSLSLPRWHPNRHMCMWSARTQKACAHGKERWGGAL